MAIVDMQRAPKLSQKAESTVDRVEIAAATNGFEVTCYEKDKEPNKKGDMPAYVPPKRYVFNDTKTMLAFVTKKISGMSTDEYGEGADVPEAEND
jgi:hypothetical protein